ncbi:SemiSWEET family sugar transporter [Magnetospirillum moscoviense]|uniref:SemiSWEET family sugar transporter n=1 Tax=Magnetospirillum moscoviense TaxID=1437059 RepID=UPI000A716FE7|nr:SemiSWEET transporter [Magnetospirillum moscoviense]
MGQITLIDVVGTIAATLTTIAFLPQVIKTLRTRRTRDISTSMWSLFSAGVALWLVYGLLLMAWPIIIANILTLVLAGIVLGIKLSNRGKEDRD